MIRDWQSGEQDAERNPCHVLPCFDVDLRGTRTLPLFSTLSFLWICGKGSDELTWLRLNSGPWTQETCSQNCYLILECFGCRNGDGAVSSSARCCCIFSSCCVNHLMHTAYLYASLLLDWWRAIGRLWPWSLLPGHLALTAVHMNNDPGEECSRYTYTWSGQWCVVGSVLCLVFCRGYMLWQVPNIK